MGHAKKPAGNLFLSQCSAIDFGRPELENDEIEYYRALNNAMVLCLRTLPASTQTEAMMFAMRYAGIGVGEKLDFFRNYYAPVWSILYWINATATERKLAIDEMRDGITAHAMAMLLHSLDDHCADGELPASHLVLLIRSQAWHLMKEGIARLSAEIPSGADRADNLIDAYYSAINSGAVPENLDDYCGRFKEQMATGLIIPLLTAIKAGGDDAYIGSVRKAMESFGVAWRILDDIRDIRKDVRKHVRTAVYLSLPEAGRALWDVISSKAGPCEADDVLDDLAGVMADAGILPDLIEKISRELDTAAGAAGSAGLAGLVREFNVMKEPLAAWKLKA